jgi:hypothetical protein
LVLVAAFAPLIVAQQPKLVQVKSLTLTTESDGFDGRLELLEDARITPDFEKTLWGSGGPDLALDEKDPIYRTLATTPLRHAVLRLIDTRLKVVAEKALDREQARISFRQLHPGGRTILVTTDLSAGWGSYSGPLTELLEAAGGTLKTLTARNAQSGLSEPIRLASTLKTAWKLTPMTSGRNSQKDILEVACRPDFDAKEAGSFIVTYTRYHWDGKGWIVLTRKLSGFWEDDGSFPASGQFPSVSHINDSRQTENH